MAGTRRRDSGTGGLSKRASDGMWVASVTLPPGPDGRRRRKVVARRDRGEAAKALREMVAALAAVGDLPTSSPTLEWWATRWLDTIAAPRLKPRTLTTYRGYVRQYIVPTIGRYRLDKLTPDHVRRLHTHITTPAPDGLGLSATTALQAHRILAKMLTDAMREGRVQRNVATLLDAPRRTRATRPALTVDQALTLRAACLAWPTGLRWLTALYTGTRQGETLGITTEALDLDPDSRSGTLTVAWQLQRITWIHGCGDQGPDGWPCKKVRAGACPRREPPIPPDQDSRPVAGGLHLLRPKSSRSWRRIPLVPEMVTLLDAHGLPSDPEGLVWGVVDPRRDHEDWKALLVHAGLPEVPIHSLRHTTATLLAHLGVPEQTRMEILGHSSATTTRGYTHIDQTMATAAMARLGGLLTQGEASTQKG